MRCTLIFLLIAAAALGCDGAPSSIEQEENPEVAIGAGSGENPECLDDTSMEGLQRELNLTLDAIRQHFENVQSHLQLTGADRDPGVDMAIKELEKEHQSLIETFEGLAAILLKLHPKDEKYAETSTATFEDVKDEFYLAIWEMDRYITEREKYWEETEADPEVMLEEEMRRLQEEEALLEAMLDPLIQSLEDSWKDVIGGWGNDLTEWEKSVKDLVSTEE